MKISVIIPALNEEQCIGKTVDYLLQKGGERVCEVIVVDGGSSDKTVREAKEAGATVLRSPESGRARQMNFGASHSHGDILYFVHADTRPPVSFAKDILNALAEGWQSGSFRYRFDSEKFMLRVNSFFTRFPWLFCQGGDKTYFILRKTFEELGGYDPGHVVMEEYDFLRRARKAGVTYKVLPVQAVVSARKYDKNSWLRVQIANFIVFNLWAWGFARPEKLRAMYVQMLN